MNRKPVLWDKAESRLIYLDDLILLRPEYSDRSEDSLFEYLENGCFPT